MFGWLRQLRLPSLSEVAGLFWRPRSVLSAARPIVDVITRLDAAGAHHDRLATSKTIKALQLNLEVSDHRKEAAIADKVAGNLQELVKPLL